MREKPGRDPDCGRERGGHGVIPEVPLRPARAGSRWGHLLPSGLGEKAEGKAWRSCCGGGLNPGVRPKLPTGVVGMGPGDVL